jgi:hypothetical protein
MLLTHKFAQIGQEINSSQPLRSRLGGWVDRRKLDLSWFGSNWYGYCRFLAVRK